MTQALGKTFKEIASEWFLDEATSGVVGQTEKKGATAFADYLDRNLLSTHLQVLALMKAREVDAELINGLIELVGKEKATEIARGIHARFMRNETSKPISA